MNKARRKRFAVVTTAVVVVIAAVIAIRFLYANKDNGPIGEPYIAFVTFDTSMGDLIRGALGNAVPAIDNGVPMKLYYCDQEGNVKLVRKLNRSLDIYGDFHCTMDEAFIVNGCIPCYERKDEQGSVHWLDLASDTFCHELPPWENGIFPIYDNDRLNETIIGIKSSMGSNRIHRNIFTWSREGHKWNGIEAGKQEVLLKNNVYPCAVVGDCAIFAAIDRSDAAKAEILVVKISTDSITKCYSISTGCDGGKHKITITEIGDTGSQLLSSQRKPAITNLQIAASPTWSYFNSADILAESYKSETILKLTYEYDDSMTEWEDKKGVYYISLKGDDYTVSYSGADCPVNVEFNDKRASIMKIIRTKNPDVNYLLVEINGTESNSNSYFYCLSVDNKPVFIDRKADTFLSSYLVAGDDSLWYVRNSRDIGDRSFYSCITESECDLVRYDPVTGDKRVILDSCIVFTMYKTID